MNCQHQALSLNDLVAAESKTKEAIAIDNSNLLGVADLANERGLARQFVGGVPPLKETVEGGGFPQ